MSNIRMDSKEWGDALWARVKSWLSGLDTRITAQEQAGYITQETDPTVPSWAKQPTKPTYTAAEVGAIPTTQKGAASGVAELDSGGKVPSSQMPVYTDTTSNWDAQLVYIPKRGDIIIYTDHGQITDEYNDTVNVPGVKIGDGSAYLIDLPFVGADVRYQILTELRAHTGNMTIHVTAEEKQFWTNKLNCTINNGNLIFNRL